MSTNERKVKNMRLDELDNVQGGFSEANKGLPTKGMDIVCPECHSRSADSFSDNALYDDKIGSVEYQCKCGCRFICYGGQVIKRADWLKLCDAKGISYRF